MNAAGTGTVVDLGANFPGMNTVGATYNAAIWWVDATTVGYAIQRIDVAQTASGTATATLPAAGTFLTPGVNFYTGAVSTVDMDIMSATISWTP